MHKPPEDEKDLIIRSWCPEDEGEVWKVLKDGSFSNVLPSFFLILRKKLSTSFICIIASFVLGYTSSFMSALLTVITTLSLFYFILWLVAVFYVYGPPLADMKDVPNTYFSSDDIAFWVAELKGKLVGTIAIVQRSRHAEHSELLKNSNVGKVAWLRRMAVLQESRGKGVAKALIETCVEFCRSHKYDKIELITTEVHQPARRLYEKFGFHCIAFRPYKYLKGLIWIWTYEYELQLK